MKITYIDCDELTVRIAEGCIWNTRPVGMSARDVVESIRGLNADALAGFQGAAFKAAEYIAECCNAVNPGSVEVKRVIVESTATQ
jgi:hypothetical protein